MNWKYEAIDKLKAYSAKKTAVVNITEEIERLSSKFGAIRSATGDGTPVRGGGSGREDALLTNVVNRGELEKQLAHTKEWLKPVERSLACLTSEERLVLDRFYISPSKGNVDRLCDELNVEKATVYRRRDDALHHFTIALYGSTES